CSKSHYRKEKETLPKPKTNSMYHICDEYAITFGVPQGKRIQYIIRQLVIIDWDWTLQLTFKVQRKRTRSIPGNYTPISVLPATSKIMERILYDQLYNYLTNLSFSVILNLDFENFALQLVHYYRVNPRLADKTVVFSEHEVSKVVVMVCNYTCFIYAKAVGRYNANFKLDQCFMHSRVQQIKRLIEDRKYSRRAQRNSTRENLRVCPTNERMRQQTASDCLKIAKLHETLSSN
ncbi:Hypothetical predicted protein, partial [Paramuricea clavata]